MSIRIYGATSGYIELDAPAVANSASVTLPTTNGVLATESFANTSSGLNLIISQSFNAASIVSINNCFTSSYDNYKCIFILTSTSAASPNINFRYRSSGTDNSTSNYEMRHMYISSVATYNGGYQTGINTSFQITTNSGGFSVVGDITGPQLVDKTKSMWFWSSTDYGGYSIELFDANTQFDGISWYPTSGTITGYIKIYGYKN